MLPVVQWVVAAIRVRLTGVEEQRRPAQRIAREKARQRRIIGSHAQPVERGLAVIARPIPPIVEEGVVPAGGEALPDRRRAKCIVAIRRHRRAVGIGQRADNYA